MADNNHILVVLGGSLHKLVAVVPRVEVVAVTGVALDGDIAGRQLVRG